MGSYISHYWTTEKVEEEEKVEYPITQYQEELREFSIKDNMAMMWITTMFFTNMAFRDDYGHIYIKNGDGNYFRVIITE